jgi:hypothetical protein
MRGGSGDVGFDKAIAPAEVDLLSHADSGQHMPVAGLSTGSGERVPIRQPMINQQDITS